MNNKGTLVKVFLLLCASVVILSMVLIIRSQLKADKLNPAGEQNFLQQFIISGGPIVWFILLPISLVTAFLASEYFLTIRRKKLLPAGIEERLIESINSAGPQILQQKFTDSDDLVTTAVSKALAGSKGDWLRMRTLVAESLQDQASGLLRKIEWLNLIGNVSPMVGLFGTVVGMIQLFNAIVQAAGQPQPAQLANGISVALVTTFWGLLIAIPALALHAFFRNRIETLVSDAVTTAEDIMPQIKMCLKKHILAVQAARQKAGQSRIEELKDTSTGEKQRSMPLEK